MKDSLDVGEMTAEMKERKWPSLGRGGVFRIYALWAERKPPCRAGQLDINEKAYLSDEFEVR